MENLSASLLVFSLATDFFDCSLDRVLQLLGDMKLKPKLSFLFQMLILISGCNNGKEPAVTITPEKKSKYRLEGDRSSEDDNFKLWESELPQNLKKQTEPLPQTQKLANARDEIASTEQGFLESEYKKFTDGEEEIEKKVDGKIIKGPKNAVAVFTKLVGKRAVIEWKNVPDACDVVECLKAMTKDRTAALYQLIIPMEFEFLPMLEHDSDVENTEIYTTWNRIELKAFYVALAMVPLDFKRRMLVKKAHRYAKDSRYLNADGHLETVVTGKSGTRTYFDELTQNYQTETWREKNSFDQKIFIGMSEQDRSDFLKVIKVFLHEFGHSVDFGTDGFGLAKQCGYQRYCWDSNFSDYEGFISMYSRMNSKEDFAEGFKFFVFQKGRYQSASPKRWATMNSQLAPSPFLDRIGFGNVSKKILAQELASCFMKISEGDLEINSGTIYINAGSGSPRPYTGEQVFCYNDLTDSLLKKTHTSESPIFFIVRAEIANKMGFAFAELDRILRRALMTYHLIDRPLDDNFLDVFTLELQSWLDKRENEDFTESVLANLIKHGHLSQITEHYFSKTSKKLRPYDHFFVIADSYRRLKSEIKLKCVALGNTSGQFQLEKTNGKALAEYSSLPLCHQMSDPVRAGYYCKKINDEYVIHSVYQPRALATQNRYLIPFSKLENCVQSLLKARPPFYCSRRHNLENQDTYVITGPFGQNYGNLGHKNFNKCREELDSI